ncbi:MAG: alcohol dehydrogenase catalytic domain-containing protein [Lactobacillus sp.]|jgi:alcohol dehydrogenase|nr:alcohol dehydrogenase catalytic domain-containing protein [Lactobacillus sp.]MCH3906579.1 alcohol dehydrogenase catalytic domain-containing protein [Lactobacillus sp.]MCH3989785.1 alcohol dehydrogenase catalytic domain-containing protein [Lactobacillus sp.]MCH4068049.1 alcohol dehydrogenase catalytic domain-containing protein [Lactobacillus sp.]MCI1303995.1 alcohol dehydrogenase catalytic domain-containing protein [Lactobacillus sp.]
MKTAQFVKAGQMQVVEADKPTIQAPDDVIIKVIRACVCGSDLWAYRGFDSKAANSGNSGHEAIGLVEAVGSEITTVKPGDFVIAPFTHGCGHCAACLAGFDGVCQDHDDNFSSGTQAEYIRFQHGQWALVKVPGQPSDYSEGMLKSLLTLADVMATGYHAARVAEVKPGDTVIVLGDGAVGQCAIIAAKMRGAKRIISTSRHPDRAALAKKFGATENIAERGEEGIQKLLAATNGGADAVLECVGNRSSVEEAMHVGRPGSIVGRVGLPHDYRPDPAESFYRNVITAGGPASVTTYDKDLLLKAVLDGKINPGLVFTKTFKLAEIDAAYQAMAERKAIKSYVVVE